MAGQVIDPHRQTMLRRFEDVCRRCERWRGLPSETQSTLIRRMERNCFEVAIDICRREKINRTFTEKRFLERYSGACSRVLSNLDVTASSAAPSISPPKYVPESVSNSIASPSTYLVDGLINGTIDAYHVAEMTVAELNPASDQSIRDTIALRLQQKAINKVSRAFRCGRCGENSTVFVKYQARAADEDDTKSIKCVACGHVWRR